MCRGTIIWQEQFGGGLEGKDGEHILGVESISTAASRPISTRKTLSIVRFRTMHGMVGRQFGRGKPDVPHGDWTALAVISIARENNG